MTIKEEGWFTENFAPFPQHSPVPEEKSQLNAFDTHVALFHDVIEDEDVSLLDEHGFVDGIQKYSKDLRTIDWPRAYQSLRSVTREKAENCYHYIGRLVTEKKVENGRLPWLKNPGSRHNPDYLHGIMIVDAYVKLQAVFWITRFVVFLWVR